MPQHKTPVVPQAAVEYATPAGRSIRVGYLLCRRPVVKPDLHPLEQEMSFTLDREHSRYARQGDDNATSYMGNRDASIDTWQRKDAKAIRSNFFNSELYNEALRTTVERYEVQKRLREADLVNPFEWAESAQPPKRQTLDRSLTKHLYLIVRDETADKWTIPSEERVNHESLRMTCDRAISTHHDDAVETFIQSNAPQGLVGKADDAKLFIFNTFYLTGAPNFGKVYPKNSDHAWITREELANDYAPEEFVHAEMKHVLHTLMLGHLGV